jgi:hypothetical protein
MTDFEVGVVIAMIFLVFGIVVGVLIVISLPQIRYYRRARRYLDDRSREELAPPREEDERPPWWQNG